MNYVNDCQRLTLSFTDQSRNKRMPCSNPSITASSIITKSRKKKDTRLHSPSWRQKPCMCLGHVSCAQVTREHAVPVELSVLSLPNNHLLQPEKSSLVLHPHHQMACVLNAEWWLARSNYLCGVGSRCVPQQRVHDAFNLFLRGHSFLFHPWPHEPTRLNVGKCDLDDACGRFSWRESVKGLAFVGIVVLIMVPYKGRQRGRCVCPKQLDQVRMLCIALYSLSRAEVGTG